MFLRDSERRSAASAATRTAGVRVVTPAGRVYFFPGGTARLAMILARQAFAADVLAAPETRIEFGTAAGGGWAASEQLKVPVGG